MTIIAAPRLRSSVKRHAASAGLSNPAPARVVELAGFAALLGVNWLASARMPSPFFSYSSLVLFLWMAAMLVRWQPRAAILFAPILLTRLSTLLSLIAIEAGAYMPEVNRLGEAGDASASFAVFTALFTLSFALVFRAVERPLASCARSSLLDRAVALLSWPVLALCAGWGALAFAHGASSGFPLIEGIDRFHYRRFFSSEAVFLLLDNKFVVAALLGSVAFRPGASGLLRVTSAGIFLFMTGLYFLFGDKFFTILTQAAFFLMPFLLRRSDRLGPVLLKGAPAVLALLAAASAVTLHIYSDYGRLPFDRTVRLLGERVAAQGELWFVASRDYRQATHFDAALAGLYIKGLADQKPPESAFKDGVETYFFIQRYAPAKLIADFRQNQGWVQLTMGFEAMALVLFGFVGTAVMMLVAGVLVALSLAYLQRAFLSGFPLSLILSVWTFLQVYLFVQQGSFWAVAAPGQIKRFLLFAVIETMLFALNWGEAVSRRGGRGRQVTTA